MYIWTRLKRTWKWSDLKVWLAFLLATVVLEYVMTSHGVLSNDYPFHYERLMELHSDMMTGQFPLIRRAYGSLQGTAVMAFYPWLTALPLAMLTFVVHSHVLFLQVMTSVILMAWLVSAYFSSKSYFGSRRRALFFAMVYTCSMEAVPFEQGDLGTSLALIFVPMVFFGFLHLKEQGRWRMLTVGMTFLIYSHVLTSLVIIGLLIILFLINIREFIDKLKTCVLAGMVTTGTTVLFWLPMLWLAFQNRLVSPTTPYSFGHYGIDLFPFLMIIVLPIVIIVRFIQHYTRFDTELLIISVLCGSLMISVVGSVAVKILPFLRYLQFSDRFMPILSVLGGYLIAKYSFMSSDKSVRKLATVAIWLGILMTPLLVVGRSTIAVDSHHINSMYMSEQRFHKFRYGMPISWGYDYAPQKAFNHLHCFDYKKIAINPHGTLVRQRRANQSLTVPITVYQGLAYSFQLNGRTLKTKNIDKRLTDKYGTLILKELPKGRYRVSIGSVHV